MSAAGIAAVRQREYAGAGEGVFMNAASTGLMPRSAAEAASDLTLRRSRVGGWSDEELGAVLRRARSAAAALVSAPPSEITLTPNTTFGVNLAAALAAAGPPGTVLLSHGEFPANVYPWMALRERGFTVEIVPTQEHGWPDEARLLERLGEGDVRVLALSAVQFSSGYLADLRTFGEACREHDVLFAVDAIQALGVVPIAPEALGVDVLAAGGQKWLCAPWGSGFAWMAPRHRERFAPPMTGWLSMEACQDFGSFLDYRWDFLDDGRKFELATHGVQDHLALAVSLEMFVEMGVERVREHVRSVQAPLLAWIESRDDVRLLTPGRDERRAGIVSFRPGAVEPMAAALKEAGVVGAVREGAIRLSPHFYNTPEQMERVVDVLEGATTPA